GAGGPLRRDDAVVGAEVDDGVVERIGGAGVVEEEPGVVLFRKLLEELAELLRLRLVAEEPAVPLEIREDVDAAVAVRDLSRLQEIPKGLHRRVDAGAEVGRLELVDGRLDAFLPVAVDEDRVRIGAEREDGEAVLLA